MLVLSSCSSIVLNFPSLSEFFLWSVQSNFTTSDEILMVEEADIILAVLDSFLFCFILMVSKSSFES